MFIFCGCPLLYFTQCVNIKPTYGNEIPIFNTSANVHCVCVCVCGACLRFVNVWPAVSDHWEMAGDAAAGSMDGRHPYEVL